MRLFLLALLCVATAAFAAPAASPSALPPHPRLLATSADFDRIRESVTKPGPLQDAYELLVDTAEREYGEPPLERVLVGRRLLATSRGELRRITNWALLYRLTGDKKWSARAEKELLSLAAFSDWNPNHFLDTAEAATAMAIGYDWIYDTLSDETRRTLRDALVRHALKPGDFEEGQWRRSNNNWRQVCETGLTLAALAVDTDEPELTARTIDRARRNVPKIFETYEPSGAYVEGTMYWDYGTTFHVLLIEALRTATGSAGPVGPTPAFLQSAQAINELTGATGNFFNYGDSKLNRPFMPSMYWFARETKTPAVAAREHLRLNTRAKETAKAADATSFPTRFLAFGLLWMPEGPAVPFPSPSRSWMTDGANPIAVFRQGSGRNSLYATIKGGMARLSHGHMDAGSFLFEIGGVRWTSDLGMPDYNDLEQAGIRLFNQDRWLVYVLGPHSHSVPLIDDQSPKERSTATLAGYSAENQSATIELTPLYDEQAKKLRRTLRVTSPESIEITDIIGGAKAGSRYRFSWMTHAQIETDAKGATLRKDGRTLRIDISADTPFEIVNEDASKPRESYDAPQPGLRRLCVIFTMKNPEHILSIKAGLVKTSATAK